MSEPTHNVIQLRKTKSDRKKRADSKMLCDSGFHKWEIVQQSQFDVEQGELLSMQPTSTRTQ